MYGKGHLNMTHYALSHPQHTYSVRIDEAATRHHTHTRCGGCGGGGGTRRRPAGREACAGYGREDGVGVQ